MANYLDGFVFPIRRDRLADYQQLAETAADIWKEHGALDYREFAGDDMQLEGTASFSKAVTDSDEETVVFGWVMFESREARDRIHERVASDPRMETLMATSDSGFDPARMAFGGFRPLVPSPDSEPG